MLHHAKRIPIRKRSARNIQIERGLCSGRCAPCLLGRGGQLPFATTQRVKSLAVWRIQSLRLANLLLRKYKMNPDAANQQNQKREDATLRPHLPASQPRRSMKSRIKQMSLRQKSTIRHGIK